MNRTVFRIMLMLLICGFCHPAFSAEKKCYPCYMISSPVKIDGQLDESAWRSLPETAGFHILHRQKYAEFKQTFFKAGWNRKNLYLGVKCIEPDISQVKVSKKDGDSRICLEDSIELFLFPKTLQKYFQFMVNIQGKRWNGIGAGSKVYPLWNWKAACFRGKGFWSLEVEIPFSVLVRTPADKEKWDFNVTRNTTVSGIGSNRYTTWARLKSGGFHDYKNFALIQFINRPLTMENSLKIEESLSPDFNSQTKAEIKKLLTEIQGKESLLKSAGEKTAFNCIILEAQKKPADNKAAPSELYFVLSKLRQLQKKLTALEMQFLLDN
ncbi:MAG: sugar-binding protein [Victivallaceae bacterium]